MLATCSTGCYSRGMATETESTDRRPATADDLERLVTEAVEIADGFFGSDPIDWERLFERLESWSGLDLPDQWDDPLFDRIKRKVRAARRDS